MDGALGQSNMLGRLITQLSQPPGSDHEPLGEEVASTVLGLLGHREVLAHPTAALQLVDATLALASALRRRELPAGGYAPGGSGRAGPAASTVLEQLQAALIPPAPSLAGAAVAGSAAGSSELESMVQRMGFRPTDLQQAQQQLALRTALAMQPAPGVMGTGIGSWAAPLLRSTAPAAASLLPQAGQPQPPQKAFALNAADTLLALALILPLQQSQASSSAQGSDAGALSTGLGGGSSGSSKGSGVFQMVAAGLLPLMRGLPLGHQQLGQLGWESYFLLEPQALQQCLAEILQAHTATASAATPLADLITQQTHWAAAAAAITAHPALHLLARRTLHSWLAESGNMAAWELLVQLWEQTAAAGNWGEGVEMVGAGAASGAQQGQQQRHQWGHGMPLALSLLHPAGPPRMLAQLLYYCDPSAQGMAEAASMLEQMAPAAVCRLGGVASTGHSSGEWGSAAAGGPAVGQHMWETLLDRPRWLLFALQYLPLQQLLAAAGGAQEGGGCGIVKPGSIGSLAQDRSSREGLGAEHEACAVYVSWVMWPHDVQRRSVLQRALVQRMQAGQADGTKGGVGMQVLLPWLHILQAWEQHWGRLLRPS